MSREQLENRIEVRILRRYFMDRLVYFALALSGAALACTIVFFQGPADLYGGNAEEFTYSLSSSFEIFVPWGLACLLVPSALVLAMPRRVMPWLAAAIAALSAMVWVQSAFLLHDFGILDGQSWSMEVATPRLVVETAGVILLFAVSILVARRRPGPFAVGLGALAAAIFVSAIFAQTGVATKQERTSTQTGSLYSFSPEKNLLVILLDSMQSDFLGELAVEDIRIGKALEGFTHFPDTTGVSSSTYLAVPTIHSGAEYAIGASISEHYKESVVEGSFINRFAKAGYRTSMIGPLLGTCPQEAALCVGSAAALHGWESEKLGEAAKLLNLSLFRAAPLALKEYIYNGGNWRVSFGQGDSQESTQEAVIGNRIMEKLGESAAMDSPVPTAKFFHLMSTHLPIIYNDKCELVSEPLPIRRGNFKNQVRCGLLSFASLVEDLKRDGQFDRTAIILLADHGAHGGWPHPSAPGSEDIRSYLVGVANPALAVKPLRATGPMKTSNRQASLTDIAATACDLMSDCEADFGRSVFAEDDAPRVRQFLSYTWARGLTGADALNDIVLYKIDGPLFDVANWERIVNPLALNERVLFSNGGNARAFVGRGWAYRMDNDGMTARGPKSEILFRLTDADEDDLVLRLAAMSKIPGLKVSMRVNGTKIGTMTFDEAGAKEFSVALPRETLSEGDKILLSLEPLSGPSEPNKESGFKVQEIIVKPR
ncbi:sulfatase-like hydrolase/transferase [Microvirga flavescens]|uniref:sulfatase-like hydrolase/transferase n=1 Tax=Microvirga flavescens TaxID=2249811 RepID=UPI000DDBC69D|nr:sulfatase-like hydrolase/transferase [Microvirga flavescens]